MYEFSADYYMTDFDLGLHAGTDALAQGEVLDAIKDVLGWEDDFPVVMRIGSCHVPVYEDSVVEDGMLQIPVRVADEIGFDFEDRTQPVLILKNREHASIFVSPQNDRRVA